MPACSPTIQQAPADHVFHIEPVRLARESNRNSADWCCEKRLMSPARNFRFPAVDAFAAVAPLIDSQRGESSVFACFQNRHDEAGRPIRLRAKKSFRHTAAAWPGQKRTLPVLRASA